MSKQRSWNQQSAEEKNERRETKNTKDTLIKFEGSVNGILEKATRFESKEQSVEEIALKVEGFLCGGEISAERLVRSLIEDYGLSSMTLNKLEKHIREVRKLKEKASEFSDVRDKKREELLDSIRDDLRQSQKSIRRRASLIFDLQNHLKKEGCEILDIAREMLNSPLEPARIGKTVFALSNKDDEHAKFLGCFMFLSECCQSSERANRIITELVEQYEGLVMKAMEQRTD